MRSAIGFSAATLATVASIRLEIVRRGSGRVLRSLDVPATAEALTAQRSRIPAGLRGDLSNLLLTDLDVSALPVQPFSDPQRNWLVRASAFDRSGRPLASVESEPFCRQAARPRPLGLDAVRRVLPRGQEYEFQPRLGG
jgi:hypothetical protein